MKAAINSKAALDTLLYKTGIRQEDITMKTKLMKKGLMVDKDYLYLGASVDRVSDDGETIVEIKNLMPNWESSIRDAAKKLKCLKLDETDQVVMTTNDKHYTQE